MTPRLSPADTLDDVRARARRRLPRGLFEFIDRGTEDEVALDHNRLAYARIKFRPRVLVDVSGRSTETTLFGQKLSAPMVIAPTGSAGLVWYRGELELARAAAAAGIPFTLATRSMSSIESAAKASVESAAEAGDGRVWFQMYGSHDGALTDGLLERIAAAGVDVLVLTVDTPTNPSRDYNERNGYSLPFRPTLRGLVDLSLHPGWFFGVIGRSLMDGGLPRFENLPGRRTIMQGVSATQMLKGDLTWEDVADLRRRWSGHLVVKGVLRADDAERAVASGADGVVVSNHGGRNLDSAIAPIDALPGIVDAVGHQAAVLIDSGVRRGSDIAKALALGADAVLFGRPALYGTAVAGQAGAAFVIERLRRELSTTMAMLGCSRLADLGPDLLARHSDQPCPAGGGWGGHDGEP